MNRMTFVLLGVVCAALAAAGCTTDGSPRAEPGTATANPYRKVFVIGVAHRDDVRRMFEDELARQLREAGVEAVPSYSLMPDQAGATKDDVVAAVRSCSADAVVVTRLVNRQRVVRTAFDSGSYYGHFSSATRATYQPPVVYESERVTLETRLFDAGSEAQVWQKRSEAFDPQVTETAIARLARSIVMQLTSKGLI